MLRTIDPNKYMSFEQMMIGICDGCIYNFVAKSVEEFHKNSKTCYPCYEDMRKKFENRKTFEIDW